MHSSSTKLAKIARKTFRKNQSAFWGSALKPKRWWMPTFIWLFLIRFLFKQ